MALFLAALVGLGFGGIDQYLGSLSAHPWLVDSSLLSAPWLLLPFIFGCTQRSSKRAIIIGCVVTAFALVGYFVMTLSPSEGVHLHGNVEPIVALLRSERFVIVGGIATAPLYGFLGFGWRTRRARASALLVGGAFCFEPLASALVGRLPRFTDVWVGEVCFGVFITALFMCARLLGRTSNSFDANP
jgi:hypothetical protein